MPDNQLTLWIKSCKRWIAKDVISEEINLRLAAMAAVFPEFAQQLKAVATQGEAEKMLARQAEDKARAALAEALANQLIAEKKLQNVAMLQAK